MGFGMGCNGVGVGDGYGVLSDLNDNGEGSPQQGLWCGLG